jgi:dTDP-4-dehydrorhamnose 3,5-epimerase
MIDGVSVKPLRRIPDERGFIMHMLRSDDPEFQQFGEIYFSTIYPGVIKAWHLHSVMALNYAVVVGTIKLVLCDQREGSSTQGEIQVLYIGQENYQLVTVPPLVWNGFKGVGNHMAIVANCATHPHDPNEISRMDPFDPSIDYNWGLEHG